MNELQEAEKALDKFVDENVSCATCEFFSKELVGGICEGPELPLGYMSEDSSMCEQHYFKNAVLEKQLEALQNKFYNAWYIVEGFRYFLPPSAAEYF